MAQHDYSIANQSGSSFRADLNNALSAVVSQNSGSAEPTTKFAYQMWADTTAGVMKLRNGANSAWITLYELDGTFVTTDIKLGLGTAAAPSLTFTGDLNTGIYSPGADQVAITTGGTGRLFVDASGRLGIGSTPNTTLDIKQTSNNYDNGISIQAASGTARRLYIGVENSTGEAVVSTDTHDLRVEAGGSRSVTFKTNGTERMRITSGGSIYIANTAGGGGSYAGYGGEVFAVRSAGNTSLFWTEGTANNGVAIQGARGTNGFVCAWFNNGTKVGDISVTASATAYNTGSDYRLKENVISLTGAIDRLNQLQVHRFNFITDPDKTVDGFIAHEAQAVVPECVTGEKDAVNDEGNPVYQGIDQSKLVPLLTAALQEAIGRIETLEAEVAALKGA